MNASEHLAENVWKQPESYGGFSPIGDFVVLTRNRDSSLLSECNWDVACEGLKAEAYDGGEDNFAARPNVYHWRAGHWACGWVEYLMVRADASDDIQTEAGEIVCSLADYPILDESGFSDREYEAVCKYWGECSVSDRADYLRDAKMSIFAARRDTLPPRNDCGMLFERLRDGL